MDLRTALAYPPRLFAATRGDDPVDERSRQGQHRGWSVRATWTMLLLLGAALSPGSAARADERYFVHTSLDDQIPRHAYASAGGFLYAATGEWQFGVSGLLATGPVTDAYMTTRSRPNPGELSILPFLAPHSRDLRVRLSAAQVRHVVDGDWMLVVKSSGFAAGRFVGLADLRTDDASVPGIDLPGRHTIRWEASGQDGRDGPSGAAEQPFAAFLHFDRRAGMLCLRVDVSNDRNDREPVAAYLAAPGGTAASAAMPFKPGPDDGYRQACSHAPTTLATALAAGGMQVTVTTAAAPARAFIGKFDVSRDDTPGSLSRFGHRLGRSLSPLPDLH